VLGFVVYSQGNSQPESVESHEVNSFLDSMLEYTTDCEDRYGVPIDLKSLIKECKQNKECSNELDSCQVLEKTLKEIVNVSWKTGENRPVKGYSMNITSEQGVIFEKTQGNATYNSKSGFQDISSARIKLDVYY
jgi:hypothetical protein